MGSSPIAGAAEDVQNGFAAFQPGSAPDMIDFFKDMPDFWDSLATSLGSLAGRMEDEMPLHPSLAEQVREMAGTAAGLRDHAQETNGLFRSHHAAEIRRVEEPRHGEEAWDVRE